MKWTAEQHEVLTVRDCNLLVAAAAGSGKTAVLVERIVRLVMDPQAPADLDTIVVVTFTQAAALEMKERIRKAFTTLAAAGDARARDQLARVSDAPISTIHSFCLNILREQFHQAGLEPGFRVGEQTECALLLQEALEQLMDDRYGSETVTPALADLLDSYAGYRDDSRLREQVTALWRFSRTMPWPEAWMNESVEKLKTASGPDFGQCDWGRVLLEEARWRLEDLEREVERAHRMAEDTGFEKYTETFAEDALFLSQVGQALDAGWDKTLVLLDSQGFKTLKRAPKDADPEVKERLQAMRKHIKDGVGRIRREIVSGPSEALYAELRAESGRMETLADLAMGLDRNYARLKRRRNLVDFDDLEHMTLGLLMSQTQGAVIPSELAVSMRARWHSVMIDEYQDSNLVQEAILSAVSTQTPERGNLFMVGDVKQSIYRFRQAMPELFLSKYQRYPLEAAVEPTSAVMARKILLHRNFRSRKPVLDAVNLAFSRLMTPQLGEMVYTEAEALVPGAVFPPVGDADGAPVTLCLIDATRSGRDSEEVATAEGSGDEDAGTAADDARTSNEGAGMADESAPTLGSDEDSEERELLEAAQEEAIWAASTIRQLVTGAADGTPPFSVTTGEGTLRPVRFRDCAILLRATSAVAQVYVEEFALQGIPLFSDTGAGYFASMEVGVVLSFLQVLDNPRQDIPLAAVLRSPLYEWGETMLAEVRQAAPEKDFLDAIKAHSGIYADACARFLEDLAMWRERARMYPVGELLESMYDETGYALHVAGLPQGRRRLANLRLLVDRAARFEASGFRGLFGFIRYVERLRLAKGDLDGAKIIGEGEDVVRLMSIHKSKGLEFPVVLLCGAGKGFNLRDRNRRILMHHRYGLGPDAVLPDSGATWATAAKQALQAVSLREMLSEEMRILYVALTRAKERLFVCARIRNRDQVLQEMAELPTEGVLSPGMLLPLRSHAHWLLAAWGPAFSDPGQPVQLVFPDWEQLLSDRDRLIAAPAREASVEAMLPTQPTLAVSVPEGQISLFEPPSQETATLRLDQNLAEARRRLQWQAPFPKLSALPSKMSVTALKRLWEDQDEDAARLEEAFRIACTSPEEQAALAVEQEAASPGAAQEESFVLPAFMRQEEAAQDGQRGFRYGTLMHLVLQHLDPVAGQLPDVEATISGLVARGLISEDQAHLPNRHMLRMFIQSELFARMTCAGRIFRETPFTILLPAADILRDSSIPPYERVVMQGIVDCWFIEDGEIVLVDYKTDRTFDRVPAYRRQLSWYATALEKTIGMPVKEQILWFLRHGVSV